MRPRAAMLSLVLGDLWRDLDPEAAIVRYRRAKDLEPNDLAAYARLARTASEAGRIEVAVEAIEEALPLLQREDRAHDPKQALELRLRAGAIFILHRWNQPNAIEHRALALSLIDNGTFSFRDFNFLGPSSVQSPPYPFLNSGLRTPEFRLS